MKIYKPVFILGSGRSGTTLLQDILTYHPDFAWFSNYTNKYPRIPQLAIFSRMRGTLLERLLGRLCPKPHIESNEIYKMCGIHPLIYQRRRSLTADDLTEQVSRCFRGTIEIHLRYQGKPRFINKNTNNGMRIPYLFAIFPDTLFVHIIRDGRAVASSLYKVPFWPDMPVWWLGKTPRQWEAEGNDPIVLCGLHWQRQLIEIQKGLSGIQPNQWIELRYEQLVADPIGLLKTIMPFLELEWSSSIEKYVEKKRIRNRDDKWCKNFDPKQIKTLEGVIGQTMQELGYL